METPTFDPATEARIADYQAKRQERVKRLQARAAKAKGESNSLDARRHEMSDLIPLGQPILIGHHSEQRDRRFRERLRGMMDRSYAKQKEAERLTQRAQSAASNHAIFSDDPQAGELLAAKIERLEARQDAMKRINAVCRKLKLKKGLPDLQERLQQVIIDGKLSEADVHAVLSSSRHNWTDGIGFPSYELTNNNANIRRLKERVVIVTAQQAEESSEVEINGIKLVENVEANRLQLIFPSKPSEAVRQELKSSGFRWSPTEGAWQRHRSNAATYCGKQIAEKYQA
jgi:hypothetical protein